MRPIRNALADDLDVACFVCEGARVAQDSPALQQAIAQRGVELRGLYATPTHANGVLADARELYRNVGIDPTRRRPSSEALLRRMLQKKGLYSVNTAVDVANLTCLHHFLSVGLYDLDRVELGASPITLRLGRPDESYAGIGKGEIHLQGRPALIDGKGPFGNPSADSFRTRVTLESTRLLFVLFCPGGRTEAWRAERLQLSMKLLGEFVGGRLDEL